MRYRLEMVSPYIYCLVSLVDKDTSSVMKDPSMSDDAVLKGMTTSSVLKLKDQDKRGQSNVTRLRSDL